MRYDCTHPTPIKSLASNAYNTILTNHIITDGHARVGAVAHDFNHNPTSGEQRTAQLIKSLTQAQTGPTVFFVSTKHLGKKAKRRRIQRYANAGHLIANHSHHHPWLHKTDTAEYIHGIDRAEALLEGFDNRRAWYRYPYLDEGRSAEKRSALVRALTERKLTNGYVTVDNYDWYIESKWKQAVNAGKQVDLDALRNSYITMLMTAVAFYDNLAVKSLERSPAHMLLLHENDLAALFIDDLVAELRKQGWQIIHPDAVYQDPIAEHEPDTLLTGQGRVAALAVDAGIDAKTLTHLGIEEEQIDQLLLDNKVFSNKADQQ